MQRLQIDANKLCAIAGWGAHGVVFNTRTYSRPAHAYKIDAN